jgi:hypothetical protein
MADQIPSDEAPDEEALQKRAYTRSCRQALIAIFVIIFAAVLAIVLFFTVWGLIGGPQYIECMVGTIDPSECHFFMK